MKIKLKVLMIGVITANLISCIPETDENESSKENNFEGCEQYFTKEERQQANTAIGEEYLNTVEKEVFYYLNLARLNPQVFANTYVKNYDNPPGYKKGYAFDERKDSLIKELENLISLSPIYTYFALFENAECFAVAQGKSGETGHDRSKTDCPKIWHAECCDYGNFNSGIFIVLNFLIDAGENNSALGHRKILLNDYRYMGVAQRYHSKYGKCSVLDFWRRENGNYR